MGFDSHGAARRDDARHTASCHRRGDDERQRRRIGRAGVDSRLAISRLPARPRRRRSRRRSRSASPARLSTSTNTGGAAGAERKADANLRNRAG